MLRAVPRPSARALLAAVALAGCARSTIQKYDGGRHDQAPSDRDLGGPADLASATDLASGAPADAADDLAREPDLAASADGGACVVVVNEVQTGSAVSASDEFIELYDPCDAPVALGGWKLVYRSSSDNGGGADIALATIAAGTTIAARGYLVAVNAVVAAMRAHDLTYTGGLASNGGAVGLRDAAGARVDSVAWQALSTANALTEGMPAPNPPSGESIARIPNGVDTEDNAADFRVAPTPTPGAPNH